jgi:hypothetical protein
VVENDTDLKGERADEFLDCLFMQWLQNPKVLSHRFDFLVCRQALRQSKIQNSIASTEQKSF